VDLQESGIPKDQLEAIYKLQYGMNSKILFPVSFPSHVTPNVGFSLNGTVWFNADHSIMTCYLGGEAALLPIEDEHLLQEVADSELPSLKSIYPSIEFPAGPKVVITGEEPFPTFSHTLAVCWHKEEFSKGSYANWNSENEKMFSQTFSSHGYTLRNVFRPVDSALFFAGEHASVENPGTMEGAVETGEIAAKLLSIHEKDKSALHG